MPEETAVLNPNPEQTDRLARTLGNSFLGLYQDVFRRDLGQQPIPEFGNRVYSNFLNIVDQTSKQFARKMGRLPNDDELMSLISPNVDAEFARKNILGEITGENFSTGIVAPQLDAVLEVANEREQGLNAESEARQFGEERLRAIDEASMSDQEQAVQRLMQSFGESRGRVLDDLSAQGLRGQPASQSVKAKLEAEFQRGLGDILRQVLTSRLRERSDVLGQTLSGIQAGRQATRDFGLQKKQLGLSQKGLLESITRGRDEARENRLQAIRQEGLARELGQLQAEDSKPGILDYVNTAIKGLGLIPQGIAAAKG